MHDPLLEALGASIAVVYPRLYSTDLDVLRLLGEWH
jgi:hypothetical protein